MKTRCCDECDNHIEKDDCYYQIKIERMSSVGDLSLAKHTACLDLCRPCIEKCGGLLQLSRDMGDESS